MGNVRQDSSIQIHMWDVDDPIHFNVLVALQKCDRPTDPASVAARFVKGVGSTDGVIRQTLTIDERKAAADDADAMARLSPNADYTEMFLQGAIEVVQSRTCNGVSTPNPYHEATLTHLLQLHTTETTTADVDKMYPEPIPGPQDCRSVVEYFCKKHLQDFGGLGYAKQASWLKANTIYAFSVGTIQKHAKDRHEFYFNYARNQREAMPVVDESETVLTENQIRERSQTNQEMVDAAQLPIHNTKNRRRSDRTQQEYLAETPESQALIDEADEWLKGKKLA